MLTMTADTVGDHDTSAGACSCESNTVRFGHHTHYMHACRENFVVELAKYGMTKRDIVSNINFFMNVPILPDGALAIVDGALQARRLCRAAGRDGCDVRDLELPAGQQSVQRIQPDADPCADLRRRGSVAHVQDGPDRQSRGDRRSHHPDAEALGHRIGVRCLR